MYSMYLRVLPFTTRCTTMYNSSASPAALGMTATLSTLA